MDLFEQRLNSKIKEPSPPKQYKPFPGMWNAFRARDFVLKLGFQAHNFKEDIATLASFAKVSSEQVLQTIHPITYARDIIHLPEYNQRALLGKDYEELAKGQKIEQTWPI